jgi:hypothetical protein
MATSASKLSKKKESALGKFERTERIALAAIGMPFLQARLKQIGAEVVSPERRSQAYLQKFVETEIAKWTSDLKDAQLRPY